MKLTCIFYMVIALAAPVVQASPANAQALKKRVTATYTQSNLHEVILDLQQRAHVDFGFTEGLGLDGIRVSEVSFQDESLEKVLGSLLPRHQIDFNENSGVIILSRKQRPGRITGRITDEKGQALAGATLRIIELQRNFGTDSEGNFSISVQPGSYTMEVTYISYTKQRKTVHVAEGGTSELSFALAYQEGELDEVVVTALGISRIKRTLGYATQEIKSDQLNRAPASNFINNLSGKVAGVQIVSGGALGSSARITIRGESSLSLQKNQPLLIIDGVPAGNDGVANPSPNSTIADYGNSASEFNPADIESLNVLKGPAAAALYGSRAANGAIIITTKRGSQGSQIHYSSRYEMSGIGRLPRMQNLFGQGKNGEFDGSNFGASWSAYPTGLNDSYDESWGPRLDIGTMKAQFDSPTENGYRGADVAVNNRGAIIPTPWISQPDNVKDFFDTGKSYFNNLSFGGGNEKGNYLVSMTAQNQQGVIPNNDLNRYDVRVNSAYKLTDKLTSSINFNYLNQTSKQRPENGYGRGSVLYFYVWMPRQLNMASLRDYWQKGFEGTRQFQYNYGEDHSNPFFLMYENLKGQDKHRTYGNTSLDYAFSDQWSLKVRTGLDYYQDFRPMRFAYSTYGHKSGRYQEQQISFREHNTDVLLSYQGQKIANNLLTVSGSIGANRFDYEGKNTSMAAPSLIIPGIYNLENAASPLTTSSYASKKRINSIYGLINLNFNDLAFLDVTARNDWSSTLPSATNSYFYPSVSLNTDLMRVFGVPSTVLSHAQLRLSWSQVGNDAAAYQIRDTYTYGEPWGSNNALIGPSSLVNSTLKPELVSSYEAGAYIGLWKNRLSLDLTYYNSFATNQIISLPLIAGSGYSTRLINAGKIQNYGYEMTLHGSPVKTPDFSWNIGLNLSHNTGKILKLTDEVDKIIQAAPGDRASLQAIEGQKMGAIWGTAYQRVQEGPMKGEVIIFANGRPLPQTENVALGNANPDWIVGLTNGWNYKNIQVSALVSGQFGGSFVSRSYNKLNNAGQLETSLLGRAAREPGNEYKDPYYVPGAAQMPDGSYVPNSTSTDGTYSAGVYGTDARTFAQRINNISEEHLFSSTYLKLKEVEVGYTFSKVKLGQVLVNKISLSLIGRNLLLWTPSSNKHFDPEVAVATSSNGLIAGFEEMTYPSTRDIGLSLRVGF